MRARRSRHSRPRSATRANAAPEIEPLSNTARGPVVVALFAALGVAGALPATAQQPEASALPAHPQEIAVDGARLHYVDRGEGEPMVLVHGTLQDYTAWLPHVDALDDRLRVIAYSRRHDWPNDSIEAAADYSARRDARDLAGLIEALELGPVHLVGHSYGGLISLLLAIDRPELVRTLVVAEPPNVIGPEAARQVPGALWEQAMLNVREFRAVVTSPEPFPPISSAELAGIRRPTLVILGEASVGTPFERYTDALVRHIPGAESVTIPGTGHGLWYERGDVARSAVLHFLDRWGAAKGGGGDLERPPSGGGARPAGRGAQASGGGSDGSGPPSPAALPYTRVHADSAGVSHFADEGMALSDLDAGGGATAAASTPLAAEGARFFCFRAGTSVDWHAAPRRQLYLILSGELEMEVADGEVRRFGSGDVLLGEATRGPGVRARWLGPERACLAVLPLADERVRASTEP